MNHKPTPRRPARPGEICSCGRPAVEVLLYDDLGPVANCRTAEVGRHRPADCPPWCTAEHSAAFDLPHHGETFNVNLDAHPWQDAINGEWETFLQPIMAGITKERDGKPAYIDLVGVDDKLAGHLTAHEAERLADILRDLAATMRTEEAAR